MGLIAKVIEFIRAEGRSEVKVNRGGGDTRTIEHFSSVNEDAVPLSFDFVQTVKQVGSGRESAVGYIDPNNLQTAQAGDKRLYARDAASGSQVAEIWIRNDGTIRLSNASGLLEMGADGTVTINSVTIDAAGNVTVPSSLVLNSKELAEHTHSQANDSSGNVEQDTGPNN